MVLIVTIDGKAFPVACILQNAAVKSWVSQRVIDSQGLTLVKHVSRPSKVQPG